MNKYKTVDEFLGNLSEQKKAQVLELRRYITEADPRLEESIKWNAPSYALSGEHRITFNLINKENLVKLVLHMGATRKEDKKAEPIMNDPSGLVEWVSDIRGYITFTNLDTIAANEAVIKSIITKWLAID